MKLIMETIASIVLCLILTSTTSVRALNVTLTANPSNGVQLGSIINLTCSFEATSDTFKEALFSINRVLLLNYPSSLSGDQPKVINHGSAISDDPATKSSVWITFTADLCKDDTPEQTYECEVTNAQNETYTSTALVTIAQPTRKITIGGEEVCTNGAKKYALDSKILNKRTVISFVTEYEWKKVNGLAIYVEDKLYETYVVENQPEVCAFGAAVTGFYKFTQIKAYEIRYTVTTDNNFTETCSIDIKDDRTTEIPTVPSTEVTEELEDLTTAGNFSSPASSTDTDSIILYGSTIALIITVVAVTILGLIGLWYLYLAKHGLAAPKPLTVTKGVDV